MSLLKKFEKQVNVIGKKSGEMVEVTKLKMSRSKLEKEIDEKALELGRHVYDEYLLGNITDATMASICENINKIKEEIQRINQQIEGVQSKDVKADTAEESKTKFCTACGNKVDFGAKFCSKCGTTVS